MKILIYSIKSFIAQRFLEAIWNRDVSIKVLAEDREDKNILKKIEKKKGKRHIEIIKAGPLDSMDLYGNLKDIDLIYYFIPPIKRNYIFIKNDDKRKEAKEKIKKELVDGLNNLLFFAKREEVKGIIYSGYMYPEPPPYELFPKDEIYKDPLYNAIEEHENIIRKGYVYYIIFKPLFILDIEYLSSTLKLGNILFLPKGRELDWSFRPIELEDYIRALRKAPAFISPVSNVYNILGCKTVEAKELFSEIVKKKKNAVIRLSDKNFIKFISMLNYMKAIDIFPNMYNFIKTNPKLKNWEIWYDDFEIECENIII